MDIFSKRDGPRPEDVKARKLLQENAGTIRRLADTISNGGFTRMRAEQARRNETPQPEGLIIHDFKAPAASDALRWPPPNWSWPSSAGAASRPWQASSISIAWSRSSPRARPARVAAMTW